MLRSAWAWLPPCIMLGLLLVLLCLALVGDANRSLFLLLNRAGQPLGERLWLHLTMLGDGAVALALVLPWVRRAPRCFWAALIAAVIAALWTQGTKQLVDVPRPLAVLGAGEFFHAGPAYRQVSFPSGHAAAAFALAGIVVLGMPGRTLGRVLLRLLALVLAGLVALSRIMVGVHWPVDVLWGMLGGWLAAWTGLALQERWRWHTAGVGGLLAGLGLAVVTGVLLVSRHLGIPAVLPAQRLLAGLSLAWGLWELGLLLGLAGRPPGAEGQGWPAGPAWLARRLLKRRTDG